MSDYEKGLIARSTERTEGTGENMDELVMERLGIALEFVKNGVRYRFSTVANDHDGLMDVARKILEKETGIGKTFTGSVKWNEKTQVKRDGFFIYEDESDCTDCTDEVKALLN